MKLGPTIDGRIKIEIDHSGDFYLLAEMLQDAAGDEQTTHLANHVGQHLDDEDWEEFVKPDLVVKFKQDILTVSNILAAAQDEQQKEFFISSEDAAAWYSTVNQARIFLEGKYELSELDEEYDPISGDPDLVEPFVKGRFYIQLQSLILEYLEF